MRGSSWAAIILLAPDFLWGASPQPFQLGRVTDLKGEWQDARLTPAATVAAGTPVYSDSKLRRAAHRSSADFVIIRSSFTRELEAFQCSSPAVCNDHDGDHEYLAILTRLQEPESRFWKFLTDPAQRWVPTISPTTPNDSVGRSKPAGIFGGRLKSPLPSPADPEARARSYEVRNTSTNLRDGIAAVTSTGALNLAPVAGELKGTPVIQICLLNAEAECIRNDQFVVTTETAIGSGLSAGVYRIRLQLGDDSGDGAEKEWSPWKLVGAVPEDKFNAAYELYREAFEITSDWNRYAAEDGRKAYIFDLGKSFAK